MRGFRQANSNDFVLGKMVYIEGDNGDLHKKKIIEILRPQDPWKAFCADDGCRYGWDGCFIEDEIQPSVEADTKIRATCAILDETCVDCEEECPVAGGMA